MEDNKPRMKMDQDLPLSPARQKTSLMPKVSLSPATTNMENTRVKFKWFSAKSLVHCLCNFGPFAGANLVGYLTGFNDQMSVLNPPKSQNIIDTGSELASFAVAVSASVFPFLFASGIPSFSGLARTGDLASPKYDKGFTFGRLRSWGLDQPVGMAKKG